MKKYHHMVKRLVKNIVIYFLFKNILCVYSNILCIKEYTLNDILYSAENIEELSFQGNFRNFCKVVCSSRRIIIAITRKLDLYKFCIEFQIKQSHHVSTNGRTFKNF